MDIIFKSPPNKMEDEKIEKKRKELLQFIKTVGATHIYTMYNFYLKECGCEALNPDGVEDPVEHV